VTKYLRLAAWVLILAGPVGAATSPFGMMGAVSGTSAVPVDVKAPSLDFEEGGKKLVASGGVTVTRGDETMTADFVTFDKVADTAFANGNVVFSKSNMVWRGETFSYNLKNGTWKTGASKAQFTPFYMTALTANQTNNMVLLNRAVFTTCTNEPGHYHYSMACKRMRVYPNDHFVARHMVIRFGCVPVFYLPYWYCSLNDRAVGMTVMAGYRARMGAFLLTSTKYWMSPNLRGITHVDYRTARGAAVGQEVAWIPTNGLSKGRVYGYALDDQGVQKDYTSGRRNVLLDSQRYRLSVDDMETLGSHDYFLAGMTYLSDQYVLQDFFEREYRNSFQPENSAMLMHHDDNYSASLAASGRLNDFFESVNRLPELRFDVQRVEIAESPFYYEGENSVGYLQKVFPAASSNTTDYSSARFDTSHEFYYPTRHFGFLNVIPRAGIRETYYSDTVRYSSVTQMVATYVTNTVAGSATPTISSSFSTNLSRRADAEGSKVRSLVNIGLEDSFRAFKVIDNDENMFGTGLRHVVEPYTDYTYAPKPNVRPDQLYQFDSIDSLDMRNDLRFGVRNRIQTKRGSRVTDIGDLDIYTTYSFEEVSRDRPFSNVSWDGEFHPLEKLHFYTDGQYDVYSRRINTFNTRLLAVRKDWRASIEYRYNLNSSSLLLADLGYSLNRRWEVGVYDRFEFQTSRLEEQGVTLARSFDCMTVIFGGSFLPAYTDVNGAKQQDEYRAVFQLEFSAFPDLKLGSARRD